MMTMLHPGGGGEGKRALTIIQEPSTHKANSMEIQSYDSLDYAVLCY